MTTRQERTRENKRGEYRRIKRITCLFVSTNLTTSLSELPTGPVKECKDGETKCILEWYVCSIDCGKLGYVVLLMVIYYVDLIVLLRI